MNHRRCNFIKVEIRNYKIARNYEYRLGKVAPYDGFRSYGIELMKMSSYRLGSLCEDIRRSEYDVNKYESNLLWEGEIDNHQLLTSNDKIIIPKTSIREDIVEVVFDPIENKAIYYLECYNKYFISHDINQSIMNKLRLYHENYWKYKDPMITDICEGLSYVKIDKLSKEVYDKFKKHGIYVSEHNGQCYKLSENSDLKMPDIPDYLFKHTNNIYALKKMAECLSEDDPKYLELINSEELIKDIEKYKFKNKKKIKDNRTCFIPYWKSSYSPETLYKESTYRYIVEDIEETCKIKTKFGRIIKKIKKG